MPDTPRIDREQARREALRLKMTRRPLGASGRIARAFLSSKLTPLLVVFSLLLGGFAVLVTPREEEPQIKVPMIDVFLAMPGATAPEVERRLTSPVEKALSEIENVEYVYSTTQPSGGMVIVRFVVGTDPDQAAVRVHTKVAELAPQLPPGALPPVVVPRGIDDVPVVAYTLWSPEVAPMQLRQVADELATELRRHDRVSQVWVLGGQRRVVQVTFDRDRLAAHHVSLLQAYQALAGLNWRLPAGSYATADREMAVDVGSLFRTAEEVGNAVIAVYGGRPVYLREIATVADGPEEPSQYVWMMSGAGAAAGGVPAGTDAVAVTVAVAKKPGSNAVDMVRDLDRRLAGLKGRVIPSNVEVTKTRDYGFTANEKSSELILHMALATLSVVVLMAFALGRREAIVVAVAVPATLALTLASSYLFGYTLNRVTLFALIFAIGILVDDAIVVVENIHRHYELGWGEPRQATVYAVDEVGNPTILATFTVVAALLPLAFVSGLMGPYMRPIPINASAAMVFSLLVAFVVSPWLTFRLFRKWAEAHVHGGSAPHAETSKEGRLHRFYQRLFTPLLEKAWRRWALLGGVALLLVVSVGLVFVKVVTVKMLPYDNKSELQIVVDMPEGATLETTAAVARELAGAVRTLGEVADIQVYAGTSAPFNFNGLVRHYFLRSGPLVADLQVNLLPKHDRSTDSHALSRRVRDLVAPIAARHAANVKVTEVPPGPPVLSTLVAEVYGPELEQRVALARQVRDIFESTPGVVDVDWLVEDPAPRLEVEIDREKAVRAGITSEVVARTLRVALDGAEAGLLRDEAARAPVPLVLRLDRTQRSSIEGLLATTVHGSEGRLVPLSELVNVRTVPRERFIYHKNLRPVTYVLAEMAGAAEAPVYGILAMQDRLAALEGPGGGAVELLSSTLPEDGTRYAVKWDGEWQITYEVFRDMGIAFAAVLVLIYLLVVGWFRSFVTPLIIMAPIPLTLVGILPAHGLGGVFFTATSMIGFIALAGIIVRNSILLVDFINLELEAGERLEEAVIKAGAVRFRPIALTAAALVVGGGVILLDPIFQGLAVALISGVVVATALTLVVIPLLYYMYLKTVGVDRVITVDGDPST
ncbi:MAG TPA: efflux RND transporter permease subunit [Thermoanaerobaculaceae bacterium]|nr:efflux RND transporter permease subunit [Thermoanaerobaculaceae bacterium]HRS17327.1 efflux RND transporter permease subunit [Thermoanaerobaculaceae bacterium]